MRYSIIAATLILSVALASAATASEIYKWTDENGNVHYTDKPLEPSSERMNIASRSTDNSAVQSQTQARLERKADAAEAAANAPAGPSPEDLRAEKKKRAEQCTMYRERLTRFIQTRHLYRENESGDRTYLDEAEMLAAQEEVQDQIKEYCN